MFLFKKQLKLIEDSLDDNAIENSKCKNFYKKLFNFNTKTNLIDEHVYRDLEIFDDFSNSKTNNNTIFEKINKTKTITGNIYLFEKLKQPTNNIELLKKQQNEINYAINSYNFLDSKIEIIKQYEKILIPFCDNENDHTIVINNTLINFSYFKFLNENERFLNYYNNYNIFIPIYNILSPLIILLIPYIISKLTFFKNLNFGKYSYYIKFLTLSIPSFSAATFKNITTFLKTIFALFIYIFSLYNSTSFSLTTKTILSNVHQKLVNLKKILLAITQLQTEFKNRIDIPLDNLNYKCLNNSIFDKPFSILSNKGLLLKTYNTIKNNNSNLKKALLIIGKLDYLGGIANLVTNENYTLVKFLKRNKPNLFIKNFKHPNLDNGILNTLNIGLNEPNNILLTGPNAGGKSTCIKSLCLAVVFAQTLSIACCEKIYMTPFDYINTYINIYDIKGEKSLFENEMQRISNHIEKLDTIDKKNKFSFIIIDELFSGTNPKEGIASSYAIAEQLGSYNNSISIITTHYNYLSKLSNYENYKMEMYRNNNNIEFTYKLKKGVSKDTIAIDLLKNKKFNSNIIEKALEIKKKL